MIKIGITGGIGSGKSVVATILSLYGIPVYIADEESKRLTNHSPIIRKKLIDLFGNAIYSEDKLNKKLLASYIFHDRLKLQEVNHIIHPEVNRHFIDWTKQQTTNICAIESAILFESGFNKIVDASLMVYAPKELRIKRASQRDSSSRSEIEKRINNQMSDEDKKELSDFVIYNDEKHLLIPQVVALIDQLNK